MDAIEINAREEYDYAKGRGFEPLNDRRFQMDIALRVSIQQELFGTGHTPAENEKFYRWCWEHNPHYCQECMKPLAQYSATYVSHILTRGAHPAIAHDPRVVNILCFDHHHKWEVGDRGNMRIFVSNQQIIEKLKKEYQAL